jgi:hypothetical protein
VGLPFATAPTTNTTGLSLFIYFAYFDISTNLALVENAIFKQSVGKCNVTGLFTIYNKVWLDYYARIDSLFNNCANSDENLL